MVVYVEQQALQKLLLRAPAPVDGPRKFIARTACKTDLARDAFLLSEAKPSEKTYSHKIVQNALVQASGECQSGPSQKGSQGDVHRYDRKSPYLHMSRPRVTGPTAPGPATDDRPWAGVPAGGNDCEQVVHSNFP